MTNWTRPPAPASPFLPPVAPVSVFTPLPGQTVDLLAGHGRFEDPDLSYWLAAINCALSPLRVYEGAKALRIIGTRQFGVPIAGSLSSPNLDYGAAGRSLRVRFALWFDDASPAPADLVVLLDAGDGSVFVADEIAVGGSEWRLFEIPFTTLGPTGSIAWLLGAPTSGGETEAYLDAAEILIPAGDLFTSDVAPSTPWG